MSTIKLSIGYIIALLLSCFLFFQNIGGINSYSDKASSDLFNVVFAPFYPVKWRDRIIVVIVDDEDLDAYSETIPPSFSFHASTLKAIDSLGPAAILLDFVFDRRHDSPSSNPDSLEKALLESRSPVFLAAARTGKNLQNGLLAPFADKGIPVTTPKFLNFQSSNIYCLFSSLTKKDEGCRRDRAQNVLPTMAWAAYRNYCESNEAAEECREKDFLKRTNRFSVFWGANPTQQFDFMTSNQGKDCSERTILSSLDPGERLFTNRCPHHGAMRAFDVRCLAEMKEKGKSIVFFDDNEASSKKDTLAPTCTLGGTQADARQAINAFKGAFVIYGGSFGANRDLIRPPTIPGIPGAHFHAMALDNLLTKSGHPWTGGTTVLDVWVPAAWFNAVFFVLIYILKAYFHQQEFDRKRAKIAYRYWTWGFLIALILVYSSISFLCLGFQVANWIGAGLITFVAPGTVLSLGERVKSLYIWIVDFLMGWQKETPNE